MLRRSGLARELKFHQAVLEATDQCMAADPNVYLMGLGAPDPKGIFGTTLGLAAKYGDRRVMDMPASENAMTGVAIGSALAGMRPIMTHQRVDFALLAFDQLVNNAAKWRYMFGGRLKVPLVVRLVIGRGWGQGPQHSQSLESVFAHIPGLKVVMPSTPYDAKGLLIAAVEDDNPVIFLEHRWLHGVFGRVPRRPYRVPIGAAKTVRPGGDVTIAASSYATLEALRAAEVLAEEGVSAEVVDMRSLRPLDGPRLLASVRKTGRLIAVDNGWRAFGFAAEIVALAAEAAFRALKCPPRRISPPETPVPTSWALSNRYYPGSRHIVDAALSMLGRKARRWPKQENVPRDKPDPSFTGPF